MTYATVNPATNKTLKSFVSMTEDQASDAVENADKAYRLWRKTSFQQRKIVLLKFAKLLRSRSEELAKLISIEMGKRISESRYEMEYCAKISEFYANGAEEFLAEQRLDVKDADAYIQHTSLGVMPWNFPFYQVVRFATPNIMAGNAVLVRHSSNVPQCAEAIAELMNESGLLDGVYTNLFIPTKFVESIISDSRVRGVSITGSEQAGASVAALAGKNLKKSVLELGGNDPFIVIEDADMKSTVESAVKGRMVNAGQSCVASKRFIVVESVAEEFLSLFKERMGSLKMGDPLDESTTLGPLSSESAAENLAKQVQATVNAGATVVLGGGRPDREGAFFNPTILTGVTPNMPSFNQELFGPVATVYVVKDEAEAITLANESSFGLGGSVYTSDIERGRRIAEQIESGMVFVNQPTQSRAELPFGGVKNSGYGRELSHLGIMEFVNKKLIHLGNRNVN